MKISLSSNPAQSQQVKQRLANPEESLSYELGKAVQELPPLYTRFLAGTITALVVGTIAWAQFSEVDEVANANGKLIPSTEVRPLRATSAGSITDIKVKAGDIVKKNDVLITIDPGAAETNVESLTNEAKKIQEDIARLEAENAGQATAGDTEQNQLQAARQQEFLGRQATAVAEANRQVATVSEAQSRLERFQENLTGGYATLNNAKLSRVDAEKSLAIARERERRLSSLENSGAVPHLELLNARQQVAQASQQVTSAANQIAEAENQIITLQKEIEAQRDRIQQAQQAYEGAKSTAQGLAPQRQGEILTQLKQRREELTRKLGEIDVAKKQQSDRETIKSPFDGTIYNVKATQGSIQPGEDLLSVSPSEQNLVLEVKVMNRDIGFIHPGQKAKVKLATFPYQEFGVIEGEVLDVSPDAVVERDENGRDLGPVFPAKILLSKTVIPVRGREVELTPGMAATADIVTRKKSILSFLIEPVTRRFSEAFSVR
ncbi:HlyD family efflux transporter periplasmic adaptor subunit [Myxacorys almedinensis]|uniref:HlyD family efflux transporter periplasmic adaptor subunit n=1 Tax=Myxacorys almedinensis A TaxID=2690445 RepID=A0A8J8CNU6_9CYAN|nr:HlyD family efflux transporter periplasmic adaptor subunit [Myxacorys almedinensis]NDJ18797.1 HlyD family efflux transporter periplasmic adaptor subunit [Myxacorys almedinensis A]